MFKNDKYQKLIRQNLISINYYYCNAVIIYCIMIHSIPINVSENKGLKLSKQKLSTIPDYCINALQ